MISAKLKLRLVPKPAVVQMVVVSCRWEPSARAGTAVGACVQTRGFVHLGNPRVEEGVARAGMQAPARKKTRFAFVVLITALV